MEQWSERKRDGNEREDEGIRKEMKMDVGSEEADQNERRDKESLGRRSC